MAAVRQDAMVAASAIRQVSRILNDIAVQCFGVFSAES